ncbi:MAG: hypothetical protein LUG13_09535 [Oscillospiraceae bacterium]|nr:hypothetical protein [Oscillospiraceae bacterium]
MNGSTGPTGPTFLTTPVYGSASTSTAGVTVVAGSGDTFPFPNVPGPVANITFQGAAGTATVNVAGIYSVFYSFSAAVGSSGTVGCMINDSLIVHSLIQIDADHLTGSREAVVRLAAGDVLSLTVVGSTGTVTTSGNGNTVITISAIAN